MRLLPIESMATNKRGVIMRRIKDWITEGVTGKRYIMGRYRKVTGIKPMRLAVMFGVTMAIVYGLGALVHALM